MCIYFCSEDTTSSIVGRTEFDDIDADSFSNAINYYLQCHSQFFSIPSNP